MAIKRTWGDTVQVGDLIRQVGDREPLNPFQAAGMAAVINRYGPPYGDDTRLVLEDMDRVLMVLDRAGAEASPYLIKLRHVDSRLVLFPKFPEASFEDLVHLTSFRGRQDAIRENLIPVLRDIPNWLDLVRILARYSLDRDDESLAPRFDRVMDIVFSHFYAATLQPFDEQARSEAEYGISRLIESILKSAGEGSMDRYIPFVKQGVDFLAATPFVAPINSFERRTLEVSAIRSALKKKPEQVKDLLSGGIDLMAAQALITALGEISPCPDELLERLDRAVSEHVFPEREQFRSAVPDRIRRHGAEEIERRRNTLQEVIQGRTTPAEGVFSEAVTFVRSLGEEWTSILKVFREAIDVLPPKVQTAFAEILTDRILEIDKPEVKELLIEGLCDIVIHLEKSGKRASKDLVNTFASLFLDRAFASRDSDEVISSLRAVESLGRTLGCARYFLMAQELLHHLLKRPLIRPKERKYTIEDDDTGEPIVLAEDASLNKAHARHIKGLIAIIASNPRIMHRLMPYLVVQIEIGGCRLCDEDLIQYSVSQLLTSNCSVTHFLVRTLIKALPYSLKDIGPLDTLRLTAAGLAKELANRGVKPIGNFLGKLRGDIHWRGSVENFYFCQGIVKYFATANREEIAEWMPPESMPYLGMESWCSASEAQGIRELCRRIFADLNIDPSEKGSMMALVALDTSPYRNDETWPEFSRRMVLEVIELVKGLYTKYFIIRQSAAGSTAEDDLASFDNTITERQSLKETFLIPDIREPLPTPVTLTEGAEDYVREMDRINREQPGTPIVLRARKAGHAYAQKATYIEKRFEAFNKDLTLEAEQETLATSINNTHFDRITLDNLHHALTFLDSLVRGVSVNGHSSYYLEQAGRDLRRSGVLGLTFDKVRDLIKLIKKELDDVHAAYRAWFEEPFDDFLVTVPMEKLPRKLKDLTTLKQVPDTDFFKNYLKTLYVSDLQARDGNLRVLETFLDKVELFLNQRLAESGRRVSGRDEGGYCAVPFYFPSIDEISPCQIGLKASLLRFAENTPPYFVITTDQPLKELPELVTDAGFREGLDDSVERLGTIWGRSFGDPSNPALFSVRSGARISMPGMMITITNVGINDQIAESLAEKVGGWFAYDCYRRFLQEFTQAAFGVERDEFQEIMDRRKTQYQVTRKADFTAEQMKTLAFDYKRRVAELAPQVVALLDRGRFLDILIHCAAVVLHSFEGEAAKKYREAAKIDGNWRTPVIVQAMIYGNMEFNSSGTGVVSYNPFTLDLRGDFALADQGTDVVDGKVSTIPVHDPWKTKESLASRMPDAWKELSRILYRTAERLHLDTRVEYTIEKGKVFILQIRKDRERRERIPSLAGSGYSVIAQGTGVSGKIFRGIMVTDRTQIAPYKHINKARSIIEAMNELLPESEKLDGFIFVVNDPVPEEIMEEVFSLPVNTALVSRLGGRGAHAADISKSLGKVYVGQVRQIVKFSGKPEVVRFDDMDIVVGSKLIIHGQTGEVALYGKSGIAAGRARC